MNKIINFQINYFCKTTINMSKNMCQVCSLITEVCGCGVDLRLEPKSVLMAPPVVLDHLCELKLEGEKIVCLPIPKLSRQINLLYSDHDEPLICDHDFHTISNFEAPKIQVLEDGEIYESNDTKNKQAAANLIAKYNI